MAVASQGKGTEPPPIRHAAQSKSHQGKSPREKGDGSCIEEVR